MARFGGAQMTVVFSLQIAHNRVDVKPSVSM
jgi:hypothetical protein